MGDQEAEKLVRNDGGVAVVNVISFLVRNSLTFMIACRHLHLKGRCIGPHSNKAKNRGESMKSPILNYSSLTPFIGKR
jgi:hypothetical protein